MLLDKVKSWKNSSAKITVSTYGHVVRRGEESYVYRSYKQEFDGNHPRGRPPKQWSDQIREGLNIPLLTLERRAANRS